MTRHFEDRPKRNFKKTFTKLYKDRYGNELNTIPSTPAKIITVKSRITARVIGDIEIDPNKFRYGIEIADPLFRMRGTVDISCGTDDHVHEQLVFGQTWETEGKPWFDETEKEFEQKIIQNLSLANNISFNRIHFSGSDDYGINVDFRQTSRKLYDETLIANGTIKIFDEVGKFSAPTVKEKNATPLVSIGSISEAQLTIKSQFPKKEVADEPFREVSEGKKTTRTPLKGAELKIGKLTIKAGNNEIKSFSSDSMIMVYNNRIIPRDTLYVEPEAAEFFDESIHEHKTSKTSDNMDSQFKKILLNLTGSGATDVYIGDNVKSASTGFMFDDAPFGTDSIAFR